MAHLVAVLPDPQRAALAAAYNEAIERAATSGTPDRWALFYDRGVSYERAGQWKKAEADLEHGR